MAALQTAKPDEGKCLDLDHVVAERARLDNIAFDVVVRSATKFDSRRFLDGRV